MDIEIVHRRSPNADAEQISINLQAVPSFEAFQRFLEIANPFAFLVQVAQMAWLPWLGAAGALMLPRGTATAGRLTRIETPTPPPTRHGDRH